MFAVNFAIATITKYVKTYKVLYHWNFNTDWVKLDEKQEKKRLICENHYNWPPRWLPCPYTLKHLTSVFSESERPIQLKLYTRHHVDKLFQICDKYWNQHSKRPLRPLWDITFIIVFIKATSPVELNLNLKSCWDKGIQVCEKHWEMVFKIASMTIV